MEKEKDRLSRRLKTITSDLKLYIEKRIELLLLNTGEQITRLLAESIQRVAGLLLVFGGVVFLLVALAVYLGNILESESLGYVIISLPLFITGVLFYYLKPKKVLENLQQHFESELIDALTPPKETENQPLNLPGTSEEKKM